MQKLVELRQRIHTVEGIEAVARTLATVSSAKLSRTRERAAGMRVYTERLRSMLLRQQSWAAARGIDLATYSPLLRPREPVGRVLVLHLAGDRGMCGNYNMSVNRALADAVAAVRARGAEGSVIVKGRLGERYVRRRLGVPVERAETWPRAGVTPEEVDRLAALVVDAYAEGSADEVLACYTRFHSPVRRVPTVVRLLPLSAPQGSPVDVDRWWHEPSFDAVIEALVPLLVRAQIEDVLLEAYASEHAARMITMQEASERATRQLQEMRVAYNRLRREAITGDLLGVLSAARLTGEERKALEEASRL